ncbi:MAG: lysozyme inhibitor LprI family protein [Candidatus Acidiferrales bacterium]
MSTRLRIPSYILAVFAFLLLPFEFLALCQNVERYNERPPACDAYDSAQVPVADLPTPEDRKSLESCNSEDLYFGFDHPAEPLKARRCAYIERENHNNDPEHVFGGSGLLTMIYANGNGATRNFHLALKFSCEVDGAQAENYSRFDHLLKLQREHWTGHNFNLCDDATSGFMEGWCADLQEKFDRVARAKKLDEIIANWSPTDRVAFRNLQQAANAFFEASSRNEVDFSGTGGAAFEIEAGASLKGGFVAALARFERGQLPRFSRAEFSKADAKLNSIYSKIQSEKPDPLTMVTVTPEGVRKAELAWLDYREAWVQFGRIKYPSVTPESWMTWLTEGRIKMLQDLSY